MCLVIGGKRVNMALQATSCTDYKEHVTICMSVVKQIKAKRNLSPGDSPFALTKKIYPRSLRILETTISLDLAASDSRYHCFWPAFDFSIFT